MQFFWAFLDKTIIPLALVGYEIVIANEARIYHLISTAFFRQGCKNGVQCSVLACGSNIISRFSFEAFAAYCRQQIDRSCAEKKTMKISVFHTLVKTCIEIRGKFTDNLTSCTIPSKAASL